MAEQFDRDGVHFQYPANWEREVEETDEGWNVSVQSPATAFFLLSFHAGEDDPAHLADSTLAALRESYPQLEAEPAVETLAGQPAVGHDINFFALDLTNSCWSRCLQGPGGSLLLLSQCTDEELETNGAALRAIGASLRIDDEAEDDQ
jgi:hypothetical protein